MALAVMMLATPAASGTFVLYRSTDAWTVLDPAAVARDPQTGHATAWSVTVQRNLSNSNPPQPGYIRTLNDYDCAGRRVRWRTILAYSRFGELVMKQENPSTDWGPALNSGEGDANLQVVCKGAGGRSAVSARSIGQLVIALMQAWDPPSEAASAVGGAKVPSNSPKSSPRSSRTSSKSRSPEAPAH